MPLRNATTIALGELNSVPTRPGVYDVCLRSGALLKVGIASNLRRRLRSHAASRQNVLRLKPGGDRRNPNDVESKSSILAKHLYYDRELTKKHDLTTQDGRATFLLQECVVRYQVTASRERARELEAELERAGAYRYVGRVVRRGAR